MTMLLTYNIILKQHYFNFQFLFQIIFHFSIVLIVYIHFRLKKRIMNLSILKFKQKKRIVNFSIYYDKPERMKNFKFCIEA